MDFENKNSFLFQPLCYKSHFLQGENKPMEETALATTIKILLETDPFKLARHQTRIDCEVRRCN